MKSQTPKTLDLTNLKASLSRVTKQMQQNETSGEKIDIVRAFEFCYKLSWLAMQEFLENEGIKVKLPIEVFKESVKAGIIQDMNLWLNFLEKRNNTLYIYNTQVLKEIVEVVPKFRDEVESLIRLLEERI